MRIPVEVERKLGVIKACGKHVSIVVDDKGVVSSATIGNETKEFAENDEFYKYVDEKINSINNKEQG